ncbi:hypothetical protein HDU97_006314 [Phlyctochytrium planicorne]|nr:hypothetical protein HDU97_006314 [Phlyctochytrium planicorne]
MGARTRAVTYLAVAECVEWKGRFLPMLNEGLKSVSAQPSWVLPAHDTGMVTFQGKDILIDLDSSETGAMLSQVHFLLASVLQQDTISTLVDAIQKRSIQPMVDILNNKRKPYWWVSGDSNWNAVCWSGVTYSYLAFTTDAAERTKFIDFAVSHSAHYRKSFLSDGYGLEGIGYFGYGFGYYSFLRETLYFHTKTIDIFADPFVAKIAMFPFRFTMRNSVSAPFGDAKATAPPTRLLNYIRWSFNLSPDPVPPMDDLPNLCLQFFKKDFMADRKPALDMSTSEMATAGLESRSVFEDAATVVMRDVSASGASKMDISFKNGGNQGHSHNDIGSYAIEVDGLIVAGDPGGPDFYTAATFGKDRYKSPLINSLGHPVPLFRKGSSSIQEAEAVALLERIPQHRFDIATTLTPSQDTVTVDLSRAYFYGSAGILTRTVVYTRGEKGTAKILDVVDGTKGANLEDGWETPVVSNGIISLDGLSDEDAKKLAADGIVKDGEVTGSMVVNKNGKTATLKFRIIAGVGEGWYAITTPTQTQTTVEPTSTSASSTDSSNTYPVQTSSDNPTATYTAPSLASTTNGINTSQDNSYDTRSLAVPTSSIAPTPRPRCRKKTDAPKYRRDSSASGRRVSVRLQLQSFQEFGVKFQRLAVVAAADAQEASAGKVGVLVEYF